MDVERQLHLFRTKRQRGETVRSQCTEFELQALIVATFDVSKNKGWMRYHPPNGGYRTKIEAQKFKRMGVLPGVADLVFIAPDGRHHYLEVKTKYGRITEEQAAFGAELEKRNVPWVVVWDYKEAVDVLRKWGCVRVVP